MSVPPPLPLTRLPNGSLVTLSLLEDLLSSFSSHALAGFLAILSDKPLPLPLPPPFAVSRDPRSAALILASASSGPLSKPSPLLVDWSPHLPSRPPSDLNYAERRHLLTHHIHRYAISSHHLAALLSSFVSSEYVKIEKTLASPTLRQINVNWGAADAAMHTLEETLKDNWLERQFTYDVQGAMDVLCGDRNDGRRRGRDKDREGRRCWIDVPRSVDYTLREWDDDDDDDVDDVDDDDEDEDEGREHAIELVPGEGEEAKAQRLKDVASRRRLHSRLKLAVQRKLIHSAELSSTIAARKSATSSFPFGIVLERSGCAFSIVYPRGCKKGGHYLKSRVTVLDEGLRVDGKTDELPNPNYTVLDVDVQLKAKTGDFDFHIAPSDAELKKLRDICQFVVAKEDAATTQPSSDAADAAAPMQVDVTGTAPAVVPVVSTSMSMPLTKLFTTMHTFSLNLQLVMMFLQAAELKKVGGGWEHAGIELPKIYTLAGDEGGEEQQRRDGGFVGEFKIHFWDYNTEYGTQQLEQVAPFPEHRSSPVVEKDEWSPGGVRSAPTARSPVGKLCLCLRAQTSLGMTCLLSGSAAGCSPEKTRALADAVRDPHNISLSSILVQAAAVAADRRCKCAVEFLSSACKPMNVRCSAPGDGSIAVDVCVSWSGGPSPPTWLPAFRLSVDLRTGRFFPLFRTSDRLLLHADAEGPAFRRAVKDAFDGVCRSFDTLAAYVGVGPWRHDGLHNGDEAAALRTAQATKAVEVEGLERCAAMASVYGMAARALAIAGGGNAKPVGGAPAGRERVGVKDEQGGWELAIEGRIEEGKGVVLTFVKNGGEVDAAKEGAARKRMKVEGAAAFATETTTRTQDDEAVFALAQAARQLLAR